MGGQVGFVEYIFDQYQEVGIVDGVGGDVDVDKWLWVGVVVMLIVDVVVGLFEYEGCEWYYQFVVFGMVDELVWEQCV